MSVKIDQVLQAAVDAGDVPCAVAMAAGDDGVIYEGAAGPRRADGGDPVSPDTMLRIAPYYAEPSTSGFLPVHATIPNFEFPAAVRMAAISTCVYVNNRIRASP